MKDSQPSDPGTAADSVDGKLFDCVLRNPRQSFFLYAGAGSGKTQSLVNLLNQIRTDLRHVFRVRGQKVAVITYTNAACSEIQHRAGHDPLFEVSTIHSFAWSLIKPHHNEIREWLKLDVAAKLKKLEAQQATARPSKASQKRQSSIERRKRRLTHLDQVRQFVYSPVGDNRGRDSLNHSEVLELAASLLEAKPLLRKILIGKYPILLIDESQDTNRRVMDALLTVENESNSQFCLGLFGDTMQRIYMDGKPQLAKAIPERWAKPEKRLNHRCPPRIVRLLNKIREPVDGHRQEARADKHEGLVRLFACSGNAGDKEATESKIAARMAELTGDASWTTGHGMARKVLTLEHHMAARRLGFNEMFDPLYEVDRFKTGLIEGTLPGIEFFVRDVLPLVRAARSADDFAVATSVRNRSPLLLREALKNEAGGSAVVLGRAKQAVEALMSLWTLRRSGPSFHEVLKAIEASRLFTVPEMLRGVLEREGEQTAEHDDQDEGHHDVGDSSMAEFRAWSSMLATPFAQIESYEAYISSRATFGTHQGVKGLEFPHVMVIIDDEEARGTTFSYERLFGAKADDGTSRRAGEESETSTDRTRRLFYVTCSRATTSLALVAYSAAPQKVASFVTEAGWFERHEVEQL